MDVMKSFCGLGYWDMRGACHSGRSSFLSEYMLAAATGGKPTLERARMVLFGCQ